MASGGLYCPFKSYTDGAREQETDTPTQLEIQTHWKQTFWHDSTLWKVLIGFVLLCTWRKVKLHCLWRFQEMPLLFSGHFQPQIFSGTVLFVQVSQWALGVCRKGEEYLLQISIFHLLSGSSEKRGFLMRTQRPLYSSLLALDFVMPVRRTTFGGHYETPSACFQSNPTFLVKDYEL